MKLYKDGSWTLDLGGICYRQLWELGQMLAELGDKGELAGAKFDLSTLKAEYNSHTDEVDLSDEDGATTKEDGEAFKIVRFYEDNSKSKQIIKTGLTESEAKNWCQDPETSSYTAQPPLGCAGNEEKIAEWHEQKKHWFDGFEYDKEEE